MRSVSPGSARWLGVLIGGLATAIALGNGIALGAPEGNAPPVSTQAPDLVSFRVMANGSPSSNSAARGVLCFDQAVNRRKLASSTRSITLYGYGPAHDLTARVSTAKLSRSNGACLEASFPANGNVGADLNGYTLAAVDQGAVENAGGRMSVPGAVGVTPQGTPEITPQPGETTGPQLTGVTRSAAAPAVITYVFNRPLDPGRLPSGSKFGYVQADGVQVRGTGAPSIAGRAVAVRFASSVDDDVRQYVVGGAVETQTQDVQNPPGAVGAAVPTSPTIASATRSTFAGSFDVTYDQPVTAQDRSKFAAYREDNSTVPGAPPAVTTLGPTTLRLSYPQSPTRKLLDVAKYASKIVKIVDLGGAVRQARPGSNPSILSAGATATPPMQEGFTTGPTLLGIGLNAIAGTATYTFDGHGGSLLDYAPAAVGLVNRLGSVTLGADCTRTVIAGDTIIAHFTRRQIETAVGGTISNGGAEDNQGSRNAGPETSGIGLAATSTTTSPTTPTAPRCRLPSSRLDIGVRRHGVAHDRTRVGFSGTVLVPAFIDKSRACYGIVHITIAHGRQVLARENVALSRRCTFSDSTTIPNGRLHNDGGRVSARFGGNGRLFGEERGQSSF